MDQPLVEPAFGYDDESGTHKLQLTAHGGSGFWMTWFTIVCTMAGTGILQLPFTLQQGGWLCLVLIGFIGFMTNYTGRILISSLYYGRDGSRRLNNYPAIGQEACGRAGKILVQVFHKATLLGVTTLFLILSGSFLLQSLGGDGPGLLFNSTDSKKWTQLWTLISGCTVLIPVLAFRTLKEIAPITAFGMASSAVCVIVVITFSFVLYPLTPNTTAVVNLTGTNCTLDAPDNCPYNHHTVINWTLFPSAFAAITLSFGGHAVFPSIEEHMAERRKFDCTFNAAYVALLVLYVSTAVAGYWVFGDATVSPILHNLPNDDTALGFIARVTKLLIALHVMTAYPILNNVAVREFEETCGITNPRHSAHMQVVLRLVMRFCVVAGTVVVAIYIPYFADFMTLVGALCLTMIVFILPVIFNWILRDRRLAQGVEGETGLPILEKVWGVIVIVAGAAGGGIGSYQAVQSIVSKLIAGQ